MLTVLCRTWDFGGQREYYATHQYFLSKRSLYLVVWRIPDGQRGIAEILQWLVNIQVCVLKSIQKCLQKKPFERIFSRSHTWHHEMQLNLKIYKASKFVSILSSTKKYCTTFSKRILIFFLVYEV